MPRSPLHSLKSWLCLLLPLVLGLGLDLSTKHWAFQPYPGGLVTGSTVDDQGRFQVVSEEAHFIDGFLHFHANVNYGAVFGIGQGQAGVAATAYWQVAAIVGAALGGWLADRWARRNPRGRTFVSAIGMGLIVPAILGVGSAGTLGAAVAFLVLFGIGWGFFDCNNMPILSQIVRPQLRATGYGIMNFVSISCGGIADWKIGALRDKKVQDSVIFGTLAAIAVVSIVLVLLIRPRPELAAQEPGKNL